MITKQQAYEKLSRIHYDFFLTNKAFWTSSALREADFYIVKAMAELRIELKSTWRQQLHSI